MHRDGEVADGLLDEFRAVGLDLHGVDGGGFDAGNGPQERGLAAGAGTQVEPAPTVGPVEGGFGEGAGNELGSFVLDCGQPVADGVDAAGVTAGQVDSVGRVGSFVAAGHEGEFFGGDFPGAGHEVHDGAFGIGGEGGVQFVTTPQGLFETFSDPFGVGVPEGDGGKFVGGLELLPPGFGRGAGYFPQDAVGETFGLFVSGGGDDFHGGVHSRVRFHPGVKQLVGTQADGTKHRRINAVKRPGGTVGYDDIEYALDPQGAVGDFGGEGGVAAFEPVFGQRFGEGQVGVCALHVDAVEHVKGNGPGQVHIPQGARIPTGLVAGRSRRCRTVPEGRRPFFAFGAGAEPAGFFL